MKKLIIALFLALSANAATQQTFEICGESATFTYYADFDGPGTNTWYVNSTPYPGDELIFTFNDAGTYNIVLHRENVICYVEETFQVIVTECQGILYWVPNSFTPDGNEFNQTFGPVMSEGFDHDNFKFTIYNRWGELLWETYDPEGRWDGSYGGNLCQDGVYTWKLQFDVLGNDGKILVTGHVTIMR
jgi:gliding motility-associated-like protein